MKNDNTYHDGLDDFNLSGLPRTNPFGVPEGYFGHLSSNVLSRARLDRWSRNQKADFSIPENYFATLTDKLQLHLRVESYKPASTDTDTWSVPSQYFEDLSARILSETRIDSASQHEALEVPSGYFDDLSARIETTIFADTLKSEVTTDGFTIPQDYAAALHDRIIAQTIGRERPKTKVRKLPFSRWRPYLAAASIAVVLGLATFMFKNITGPADFTRSQLTRIPEEEIINYLSALNDSGDIHYIMECIDHIHDSEGICTHVKENDIEDYLNYAL